jgi:hypothetical protein
MDTSEETGLFERQRVTLHAARAPDPVAVSGEVSMRERMNRIWYHPEIIRQASGTGPNPTPVDRVS